MAGLARRRNLAEQSEDSWRPPLLTSPRTPLARLGARLRRYFDLQAGSIWDDVAAVARGVSGKVVDVGCGAQPYRCLFPPTVEYIGIDLVQSKEAFGYDAPDTVRYSGSTWPPEAAGADALLCTETLEHVRDPAAFLEQAFGCLRPGGRLLLTVPFAARWHFIPHDYWRFTPSALKLLLEGRGFRAVAVYARGNALTVACSKAMALALPLLMPQRLPPRAALARRLLAAPLAPAFVALAVIANASLSAQGGDDCLGYTVLAERPVS
jgi:SAM-dependent methyltransferase